MEFKFNFHVAEWDNTLREDVEEKAPREGNFKESMTHFRYVTISDVVKNWKTKDLSDFFEIEEIQLPATDLQSVSVVIPSGWSPADDADPAKCEGASTDLVPDVYEGGFKVWECTLDLVSYLAQPKNVICLKNKKVLDLGCGVGILGLYALQAGAKYVMFQDYNEDVITLSTGPTILLNSKHSGTHVDFETQSQLDKVMANKSLISLVGDKTSFFAGDWSLMEKGSSDVNKFSKYDVILSAETIYSESCYPKLHDVLQTFLAPHGVVYVGAKIHYFGVGGGVQIWCDYVKSRGVFDIEVCLTINDHLQRALLRMKFKANPE